jgi:GNAT superfamily N-acetyltransferase
LEYEREYLGVYQRSAGSLVVLVTSATGLLIGATTCLPLVDEGPEFRAPFIAHGCDLSGIMYFGESIVLPEWRGQGLGGRFFDFREAHARRLGMREAAFCAVDRGEHHPARPLGFRPLDGFWRTRGYEKQPGLRACLSWKDVGEDAESAKWLTFWSKRLTD